MKRDAKPLAYKRIFFEPVAPYFADAYTNLCSIVQGLALGVFGWEVTKFFFDKDSAMPDFGILKTVVVFRLLIAFFSICVIWHRYISHTQFYAWRLGIFDTIIPMVFGLLEIMLILSISKASICFDFFFACLAIWGIIAYWNTILRYNDPPENPTAKILYRKPFEHFGNDFSDAFFAEITRFERKAQLQLLLSGVILWTLILFMCYSSFSLEVLDHAFVAVAILSLVYMMFFDLWRQLEKSPRLEKFWRKLESI